MTSRQIHEQFWKPTTPILGGQLKLSDLQEEGLPFLNAWKAQIENQVNKLSGATGPTQLPAGVDVKGSTVSNIGEPQSPTDAISKGHAEKNYSAAALAPKLESGSSSALKILSPVELEAAARVVLRLSGILHEHGSDDEYEQHCGDRTGRRIGYGHNLGRVAPIRFRESKFLCAAVGHAFVALFGPIGLLLLLGERVADSCYIAALPARFPTGSAFR